MEVIKGHRSQTMEKTLKDANIFCHLLTESGDLVKNKIILVKV
jgi:hypothetical protein